MSTPNNAKNIALHGTGLLLSTLAGATSPHVANIGFSIQNHPAITSGIAGAAGAILYAWALWTFSLWKKDSKKEEIRHAYATGRIVCHCNKDGEILTYSSTVGHGSGIDVYYCKACGNYHTASNGEVLIGEHTEFNPPLPEKVRQRWLEDSKCSRGE